MPGCIMASYLKKVAVGVVITLVVWSTAATPQTSSSQQAKSLEAEASVGLPPKIDQLKALRAQAEAAKDLSESDKKNVLSLVDRAIGFLEEAERFNAETREFSEKIKKAPIRTKEIETRLKQKVSASDQIVDPANASQMTNADLEQREREEIASLLTARESLKNIQDQILELQERPLQLQKKSADTTQRLLEVRNELSADRPAPKEPGMLTEARRAILLAEHAMLKAQIYLYEQQLLNHETFISLLTAERDLADIEVARREAQAEAWQAIAQQRRQNEASQARKDAEASTISAPDLPPPVKKQYDINVNLAKELEQLTVDEARAEQKLVELQSQLNDLEAEFVQIRQRVQGVSLSETMGLTLRQRRSELPGPQSYRRSSAQRKIAIGQVSDAQFVVEEKRQGLADIKAETERILKSLKATSEANISEWRGRIQLLLLDRRDILDKLQNAYRRYYQNLQSLEFTEQQISSLIDKYASFLDGHLLWIRSSKVFGPSDLWNLPAAFLWLINPKSWWRLFKDLVVSFAHEPILWILGLLTASFLFAGRRRAKSNLKEIAKIVGLVRKDSLMLTIRAIGLTLYLACGRPFLMVLVGWRLSVSTDASDFSRAAGFGLLAAGYIYATLSFLHYLCHENGVPRIHFRWRKSVRDALKRQLLRLEPLWVPLAFMIATLEASNKIAYGNSLGRLAFIVAMTLTAICIAKVFRVAADRSMDTLMTASSGLLRLQRFLGYPLSIGLPALLVVLAVMGYYYTALQLGWAFQNTALLVLGLVLSSSLALRSLVIAQRRLAYEEEVRKRQEEIEAKREQESDSTAAVDEMQIESFEIEEPEISQAQITEQTRALLQTLFIFFRLNRPVDHLE